jgi:ketosteroid isomerase-like protein
VILKTRLSVEQVQAEVARFWSALTSKSAEAVESFYAQESTVFGTSSSRPEPGRLAAIRREREYFHPQTTLRAQTSPVEVHFIGDNAAIASYTFQFHASHAKIGVEKASEEHVMHGRATQVFELQPDGELRVVHEHFSVIHKL